MKLAVLDERMKPMQTEYRTDIARLAEDMAKRDTEFAKRDKDNRRWHVGMWVATVVLLGVMIRWPG
ncbi:MAG: hypothetical protein OXF74_10975 [Rhodobacteraceae bacterium]|nr:hypothetical protein [Paracoccaceae bacterium]